jgi:hypothetical protein
MVQSYILEFKYWWYKVRLLTYIHEWSTLEPSWQPLTLQLEILCRQEPKPLLWCARIVTISMWRPSMELGHNTAVMLYAQQLEGLRWLPCAAKAGWRTYNSVKGLHFSLWDPVQLFRHHQGHAPFAQAVEQPRKLQQLEASGHKAFHSVTCG